MKVLKEDCKVAQRIREVEQYLREKGISISFRYDGMLIDVDGETFVMIDGETKDNQLDFPSQVEPTKIQTIDNYICEK